jgi:quinol monooxygenase YgiN
MAHVARERLRAAGGNSSPVIFANITRDHAHDAGSAIRSGTVPAAMTTISKDAKLITFINVFTVEPANQQRLVELLAHVTETSVRHAAGFVSSALHRSIDGTKVTMYAQWRTIEDYETMRKAPAPLPYLKEALTIARFEPGMYEVIETYVPPVRTAE